MIRFLCYLYLTILLLSPFNSVAIGNNENTKTRIAIVSSYHPE